MSLPRPPSPRLRLLAGIGLVLGLFALAGLAFRQVNLEEQALQGALRQSQERALQAHLVELRVALRSQESALLDELPASLSSASLPASMQKLLGMPGFTGIRGFAVDASGRPRFPGPQSNLSPPADAQRLAAAQDSLASAAASARLGADSLALRQFERFLENFRELPGLPQGRPFAAWQRARLQQGPAAESALVQLELELARPELTEQAVVRALFRERADSLALRLSASPAYHQQRNRLRAELDARVEARAWLADLGGWLGTRLGSELARGGPNQRSFQAGERRFVFRRLALDGQPIAIGFEEPRAAFVQRVAAGLSDFPALRLLTTGAKEPLQAPLGEGFPAVQLCLSPEEAPPELASRRLLLLLLAVGGLVLLGLGPWLLWRQAAQALRLSRMQADFVAGISHELRTPLALIRAVAETLQLGHVSSEEERQSYLKMLTTESERLSGLVGNVLDFSRAARGAVSYARSRLDVRAELESFAETYGPGLRSQGFSFELELPRELPSVPADAEAVRRALLNLLDNAIKFSPTTRSIRLAASAQDTGVAIRLSDRGLGVPAEERAHIFEPFNRGREAKVAEIRGTGLGLALVRQIARGHDGYIRLHPRPGGGSIFELWLPAVAGDLPP